jgi:membrane protein YqaA with SNARE-associated domain
VLLPAPGIAVVFAMGAALDPVWLGIVAGVGSTLGELSGYIAGASGRALIVDQPHAQRLTRLTQKYGPWLLFVMAFLPMPVFDLAGIVAGALKMRLSLFLVSVGAGKICKHILVALMGAGSLLVIRIFFGF